MNNGFQQMWAEIKHVWNYALSKQFSIHFFLVVTLNYSLKL